MVELSLPGRLLRMLLMEARPVAFEDDTRGCVITVDRKMEARELYVQVEHAALHEVVCDEVSHASCLTFTYVY